MSTIIRNYRSANLFLKINEHINNNEIYNGSCFLRHPFLSQFLLSKTCTRVLTIDIVWTFFCDSWTPEPGLSEVGVPQLLQDCSRDRERHHGLGGPNTDQVGPPPLHPHVGRGRQCHPASGEGAWGSLPGSHGRRTGSRQIRECFIATGHLWVATYLFT